MARWTTAVLLALGVVVGVAAVPAGANVGADGWDRRAVPLATGAQVIVGNFGGDAADDVLFYRPGAGRDTIWYGRQGVRGVSQMVQRTVRISGSYQPIVGDFAGNGAYDEILWYAPGSTQDFLWMARPGAYDVGSVSRPLSVHGDFTWAVLEDHGGGKDDIAWIAKGDARDFIWHFDDSGSGWPHNVTVSAQGPYELEAGDFDGNGYDDLVLHAPGPKRDELWRSSPQGTVSRTLFQLNRGFDLVTIRQAGGDDLLLRPRGSGTVYDLVWEHGSLPFQSGTVVPPYPQGRPSGAITLDTGRVLLFGEQTADYLLTYTNHGVLDAFSEQLPLRDPHASDFDLDGNLDVLWHGQIWYGPA